VDVPRALGRFMQYVVPYWGLIALATLCGLMKFILPSSMALTFKFITDRLVGRIAASGAAPASDDVVVRAIDAYLAWAVAQLPERLRTPWGTFNVLMVTLVVVYAVWAVSHYYRSVLAQLAGHRVILDLRADLYRHITRLSHSFFHRRRSGAIVSRMMADIALAQNFVGSAMTNIWMDLASCVFYVYVLFAMDARLAAASLLVFPFYVGSMRFFGERSTKTSREVQEAMEAFSGEVQERVSAHGLVKSFAAERREVRAFYGGARDLHDLTMQNVRTSATANTVVQWLTQMATLGVIWYGSYRLVNGATSVGTVVAFILLLRELYFPVNRISELSSVLHNSIAAIHRVFEFFDEKPDVVDRPGALHPGRLRGAIAFEGVTFAYDAGRPVLHDVSLSIAPGEVVALVGPSGAGKSTIAQLVPRFYDPQAGRVLIDGHDLRDLQLRPLRAQIAMVQQETLLLSGSARENILYGRPRASAAEVEAAARAAHADEFIRGLPEGYDTLIGERGAKLSGGQRQRIALARAFLADPRILVLDEATSALDSKSEALVQESLARLLQGRTCLVIAHRLSTIRRADRIAVVDRGRIVELGAHDELVARGGLYADLYATQVRGGDDVLPDP
jgi:ATP-binding cassette, subfamily B, putative efflux pump